MTLVVVEEIWYTLKIKIIETRLLSLYPLKMADVRSASVKNADIIV